MSNDKTIHHKNPVETSLGWKLNKNYNNKNYSHIDKILNIIKNTRSILVLSSFFIADKEIEQALIDASKRKVRCYIMISATNRLRSELRDDFDKQVYKNHLALLKNLAGRVLIHSSDDFHAKVILADPHNSPSGFLLTANLGTAGLRKNLELLVPLKLDEIKIIMDILKWAFWKHADHKLLAKNNNMFLAHEGIKTIQEPQDTKNILRTTPKYHSIREKIIKILDSGSKKIIISSYGWDENSIIVNKLCKLSASGTSITVLARIRDVSMKAIIKMKNSNIRVLGFKQLHAKTIISDSQTVVMSANIEKKGLDEGFELGIELYDQRANDVKTILNAWINNPEYEFLMNVSIKDKTCIVWDGKRLKHDTV